MVFSSPLRMWCRAGTCSCGGWRRGGCWTRCPAAGTRSRRWSLFRRRSRTCCWAAAAGGWQVAALLNQAGEPCRRRAGGLHALQDALQGCAPAQGAPARSVPVQACWRCLLRSKATEPPVASRFNAPPARSTGLAGIAGAAWLAFWSRSQGLAVSCHSQHETPQLYCRCAVLPEQMRGADGAVTALCAHSAAGRHRVLIAHENTGALVWDLRCPPACHECLIEPSQTESLSRSAACALLNGLCGLPHMLLSGM